MSKEKQIEEMVRIASKCITSWLNNETPKALPDYIAEALYNVGYRKQSAIIRCKDCEHYGLNSSIDKNKHCLYFSGYDEIFTEPNDYCSFAKMKGGAE